ncbi:hypothetical protein RND81_05G241400 [Saponaria officinalis]|uniref:FLZ-type domain-containing protein n=1 Tax=Saponaria officinalis TaxID=3572 RepID=A0AAW1L2P7_SAPOF
MVIMVERKKGGISSLKTHVGLRIVEQIFEGESNNVVALTRAQIISSSSSSSIQSNIISHVSVDGDYNCFLKSCHFCKNPLRFDKDIYMYRGDQGFCSIECRKKQIMKDERNEMEAKYKQRVAISQIDCRGCETCKLLQDLRQRNKLHHTKQPPLPILSIS